MPAVRSRLEFSPRRGENGEGGAGCLQALQCGTVQVCTHQRTINEQAGTD
jgi:hypothetical protein